MLPGSESGHIEVIAACLALVHLVTVSTRPLKTPGLLMAGITISLACLIRPNYAFAAALGLPIVIFSSFDSARERAKALLLFAAGFAAPAALMAAPYLFVPRGIPSLIEGLYAVATYSSGPSFAKLQSQMFTGGRMFLFFVVLYGECLLAIFCLVFGSRAARADFWKSASVAIAMVAGLHVSHGLTHYWSHNALMFAPPALVLLQFLTRQVDGYLSQRVGPKALQTASLGAVCLLTGLLMSAEAYKLYRDRALFSWSISSRSVDPHLLQVLQGAKSHELSFLVVDGSIYHAILGEPRVGDGHPFILQQALIGKKRVSLPEIPLLRLATPDGACNALVNAGKDIIIIRQGSDVSSAVSECLKARQALYRPTGATGDYTILRRN